MMAVVGAALVVAEAAAWVACSCGGARQFQRHDGQDIGAVGGVGEDWAQA